METEEQKDYTRLIAAQNEAARRLRIREITNTLTEENNKRRRAAIAAGVFAAIAVVAAAFSGTDPNKAIQTEIEALNSFEAFKLYLSYITPAMWAGLIGTASNIAKYIKHREKYIKANQEFYDMQEIQPEDYLDIVEHQSKSK